MCKYMYATDTDHVLIVSHLLIFSEYNGDNPRGIIILLWTFMNVNNSMSSVNIFCEETRLSKSLYLYFVNIMD